MASGRHPLNVDHYIEGLASLRNCLRLKDAFIIAQAISDFPPRKQCSAPRQIVDVCCPLPFTLQDLCLLVIISDLDCHRNDVLASLPRWLRKRLLSVLPALDVGRLESTPVADGIDVDSIWKCRCKNPTTSTATSVLPRRVISFPVGSLAASLTTSPSTAITFQLNICKGKHELSANPLHKKILEEEMKSALKKIAQKKFPEGKDSLLTIASDIMTGAPNIDLTAMIHKLISIDGELVFSNLLSGSMHLDTCRRSTVCRQGVWKKQAAGLAVNVKFDHDLKKNPLGIKENSLKSYYLRVGRLDAQGIMLTPHRSLPIMYNFDPLEVLVLLARDCHLQPASVYIHIDSISETFLREMCSERLIQDCGLSFPSDRPGCTSTMNLFLEKVIALRLRCDSYSYVEIMISMIEAATAHYQLTHLYCTLPNLYMDLIKPLSHLFSVQNFYHLMLEVEEMHVLMLSQLLKGFIMIPCTHLHKLTILVKKGIVLPTSLKENQLPANPIHRSSQISSTACSAEHKILQFASKKELTQSLYLILQLPTIRLKEIALVDMKDYHSYVHLCAIHPDLQTTKLTIDLSELDDVPYTQHSTYQVDMVALLGLPSLQKITVTGNWGKYEGVKLGLIQGLLSRSSLHPLRKLALELECNNSYKMADFQALCNAIFSLPQLENLKLVLGKGFADMLRQPGYETSLYRSWCRKGSKVQLKSVCLQTFKTNYNQLSLVTQNVTFAIKEKKYNPRRNLDLDFDRSSLCWAGDDDLLYYDDDYDYYDDNEYYDDY